MAEKHETTVRRLIDEVWNQGRLDVIESCVTPDFRHQEPLDPTVGIEPYRNVVKKYRTAFPDCRMEIDELLPAGDRMVLRWTATGTHRGPLEGIAATGRRARVSGIALLHFSGSRIAEVIEQWDALGMLQQLGAVTLPGRTAKAGD